MEHYLELYSTQTDAALDVISQLPIMEELDEEPLNEEANKTTDCLSSS